MIRPLVAQFAALAGAQEILREVVLRVEIDERDGALVGKMRRREQVKLKIRALSSEARASAAIIGALPFVMFGVIFTINPSYLMVLFTDPRGWLLLAVGFLSLGTGIAVMVKMIRLEI